MPNLSIKLTAPALLLSLSLIACGAPVNSHAALGALAAAGQPVINEVYYDSPGTDAGTFIELRGPAGLSLSGYTLTAYNSSGSAYSTIPLSGAIPASGYFVVAQDTTVAARNQVNAGTDLYNTSGSLRLTQNGTLIDALAYGNPGTNLGEGASAPTAGGSAATGLSRTPDGADTNSNASDFKAAALTPGASNGGSGGGTTTGKKVLFDLTKHEDAGASDWRIDGGYSSWASDLRALGYTVNTLSGTAITSTALSGASVLVIPEPQNPFSDAERSAIQSFVQNGGGVLLIGDHRDSDRDNDGWDSPEVFDGWDGSSPASVTSTLQRSLDTDTLFGLNFSFNSSFNDPVYTATPLSSTHPVIAGSASTSSDDVASAGVYVGTSLDVLAGQGLMGANGKTYLAVNTYGSGRVAAWGDSSTFSDGTFSDGTTSQYKNWTNLSNANLGKNLVRWLGKDL